MAHPSSNKFSDRLQGRHRRFPGDDFGGTAANSINHAPTSGCCPCKKIFFYNLVAEVDYNGSHSDDHRGTGSYYPIANLKAFTGQVMATPWMLPEE